MAAKKKAKTRRSPADIKKAWQNLHPALAEHRREHERQGETFRSITREEFEAKVKRVNSAHDRLPKLEQHGISWRNDQLLGWDWESRSHRVV